MTGKRGSKTGAEELSFAPQSGTIPAAEALSFLRETRGATTWTATDMSKSLKVTAGVSKQVIAVLELQGYVKQTGADEFITTPSGEAVSGSKSPRFALERVEQALAAFAKRIAEVNKNSREPYRVTQAVAFGDFLLRTARVQAAEVGIQLARRGRGNDDSTSAKREFLKQMKVKGGLIHLRRWEEWMSQRTHQQLL